MTSAEFAAKYRVLKTLSENGARSQIAQEIGLGRMVMVHHLDVGTPAEREWLLTQARSLDGEGAGKIFAILDVDGTPVIVTHFLASFVDLPTWLSQHAGAEVDLDKTQIMEAPVVPPPAAPTNHTAREPSFTTIFGKQTAPAPANTMPPVAPPAAAKPQAPPAAAPPPPPPSRKQEPGEFTRVFQGLSSTTPPTAAPVAAPPTAAPVAAPPTEAPPPRPPAPAPPTPRPTAPPPPPPALTPPPAALSNTPSATPARPAQVTPPALEPPSPGEGFTSVFGKLAPPPRAGSSMPSLPPQTPPIAPPNARPATFDSVMRPVDPTPPTPAAPQPSAPPPPVGGFTDLFKRLEVPPAAAAPLPPRPAAPPAFGSPPVAPPVAPPATPFASTPAMPSAGIPASGGPSEFTRVLGRVSPPPAPQLPAAGGPHGATPPFGASIPGAPTPQIAPPAVQPQPQKKSYLPLIIALNVVVLLAIVVVLVFVLGKH